ncbi:hypothetical protein QTP86_034464 [Hemibagrus guttatus]|nr:hypothetical protein QTP86_034464 [Hemibagrus guttatus]
MACRETNTMLSRYISTAIRLDNLRRQQQVHPLSHSEVWHRPEVHKPGEEYPEPMQLGRFHLSERASAPCPEEERTPIIALIDSGAVVKLIDRKTQELMWTEQARNAFTKLKLSFTTAPILRHPDPELPFVVEVDASSSGIGAILS